MSDDTFVILLIAIGISALVDILLVRQIRRLQRRIGVNSEALRMLVGVDLPPEATAKPDLRVIKGGLALLLLLLATLSAWTGRHLRAVSAAAGAGAAVTAGVLLSVHGSAAPRLGPVPAHPVSRSAYPPPAGPSASRPAVPPSPSASAGTLPALPPVPGSFVPVGVPTAGHPTAASKPPDTQGPGHTPAPGPSASASPTTAVCVLRVTLTGVLNLCV